MNKPSYWSKTTHWLHALITLGIISQLIFSLLMVPPDEFEGASELSKTTTVQAGSPLAMLKNWKHC